MDVCFYCLQHLGVPSWLVKKKIFFSTELVAYDRTEKSECALLSKITVPLLYRLHNVIYVVRFSLTFLNNYMNTIVINKLKMNTFNLDPQRNR